MLSDEELMILGGFYSLNWACKKSALFMWVLPVVVLSEEEQFFLSYADMIFREGCSSSFAERNLRFFCSSFEKEDENLPVNAYMHYSPGWSSNGRCERYMVSKVCSL